MAHGMTTIMIDQTILNSLLVTLIGGLSGLFGAWVLSWRRSSETRAHVATTEANSDAQLVGAILQLAQGMTEAGKIAAAERQQTLMAIERSSGRIEGMMAAIVDQTKSVKEVGMQIDEFGGRIKHIPQMRDDVAAVRAATASLETNLGESFSEQFIPVVNALRAVEAAVRDLAKELEGRDGQTAQSLVKLTGLFYEAKLEFMRRISPDVEQHIQELLPSDPPESTNGKKANETAQELPVNIHITSAAPPKEPKP